MSEREMSPEDWAWLDHYGGVAGVRQMLAALEAGNNTLVQMLEQCTASLHEGIDKLHVVARGFERISNVAMKTSAHGYMMQGALADALEDMLEEEESGA